MDPATGVRSVKLAPHELTHVVTAPDGLFILAHLGIPRVDPLQWSLTIDGMVDAPRRLDLHALKSLPKVTVEAVHNCCGSPLEPAAPTRRAGNVRWGGVDLAALLADIGIESGAQYLWSYGLDGGEFFGTPVEWYVKDLPLTRLSAGGVLIAYELNGAPLPAEHGFPARLVVPGFYGTNSVKWLWRLQLAGGRFDGLFCKALYNDRRSAEDIAAGLPAEQPVWAIAPESLIVSPAPESQVAVGETVDVRGWAWSWHGVADVEISFDEGASFTRALLEARRGWAWQRFSLPWHPLVRGDVRLCARAVEANGVAQPRDGARNAMHVVPVSVR